jgi:polyisoprenoid-binding protein YceI
MNHLLPLIALSLLTGTALSSQTSAAEPPVPAGDYRLDKHHATLLFRVDHVGFSNYTGWFERFDAQLYFDPVQPERSRVSVTIDPASLQVGSPPEGFLESLRGPKWLDAGRYGEITFRSTKVTRSGELGLWIEGELSLHGVSQPMTLEATYNGGYASHPFEPQARIGFSAQGTLKRSLFGITYGIPAAGSKMGVGDEVQVIVEAEFSGPPKSAPAQNP